jgi:hypothetical protein
MILFLKIVALLVVICIGIILMALVATATSGRR